MIIIFNSIMSTISFLTDYKNHWFKDEENNGFNTSDEEFERQLAEAAVIQAEEKFIRQKKPKVCV